MRGFGVNTFYYEPPRFPEAERNLGECAAAEDHPCENLFKRAGRNCSTECQLHGLVFLIRRQLFKTLIIICVHYCAVAGPPLGNFTLRFAFNIFFQIRAIIYVNYITTRKRIHFNDV